MARNYCSLGRSADTLQVLHLSETLTTARERFGNAAEYKLIDNPNDALGELDANANTIAVLPFENTNWWKTCRRCDGFCCLALFKSGAQSSIKSLCVGCITIEPSGEDVTLLSCPIEGFWLMVRRAYSYKF